MSQGSDRKVFNKHKMCIENEFKNKFTQSFKKNFLLF